MAELNIEGMEIAPNVVETIVSLAARSVDGVVSVGDPATSGILSIIGGGKPSTQGIEIGTDEDGNLLVSVRLHVKSGQVLPELAVNVRQAIADALSSQVGVKVGAVDIYIDGIQFNN